MGRALAGAGLNVDVATVVVLVPVVLGVDDVLLVAAVVAVMDDEDEDGDVVSSTTDEPADDDRRSRSGSHVPAAEGKYEVAAACGGWVWMSMFLFMLPVRGSRVMARFAVLVDGVLSLDDMRVRRWTVDGFDG